MFEPEREIGFLDLARDRALVGQEQVLGELLGDRRAALHDAAGVRVDGERAQRADHVDAEMVEEAAVLGRQHRLDEMIGQFVERDGVVVLDAAPADLDAVAVEESDREILALQPVLVAGLAKGGLGERQHDERADQAEIQALAGEFDRDFARRPRRAGAREKRERRIARDRAPPGVVKRGIDEGVEGEQRPRDDFQKPTIDFPELDTGSSDVGALSPAQASHNLSI